jgi:hypothetical protein
MSLRSDAAAADLHSLWVLHAPVPASYLPHTLHCSHTHCACDLSNLLSHLPGFLVTAFTRRLPAAIA